MLLKYNFQLFFSKFITGEKSMEPHSQGWNATFEKYFKSLKFPFILSVLKKCKYGCFLKYLTYGETVIFLGSSGVGKSTITNFLVGDEKQKIQLISKSTGKGRHTTSNSELIFLQAGGIIVDTPGVRELQLWGDEEILDQSFEEIKQLSYDCKFKNCQHRGEPGCAIQKVNDKNLSQSRVDSYKKQLAELQRLNKKRRDFEKKLNKK
jgi:ribosome biogenesis GTPase / thiamine phosphate phosphatase